MVTQGITQVNRRGKKKRKEKENLLKLERKSYAEKGEE